MKSDLATFYRINRSIFGVCRKNGTLFRLSDANIFVRTKPKRDWLDEINSGSERLDRVEDRLDKRESALRDVARKRGRALAMKAIKLLDPVFTPRKLNPDDAKVLFHPVDYVVFRGMKVGRIKSILLLDRDGMGKDRIALQRRIGRIVERGNYEWLTIRIDDDGNVREQE